MIRRAAALSCLLLAPLARPEPASAAAAQAGSPVARGAIRIPSPMEIQPSFEKYLPVPPRYALVFVELTIGEKGEILEASLGEGGYHDRESVQAALQIARRIRLRPATRDGKPIKWIGTMPVRFTGVDLSNSKRAVTPDFQVEAVKVQGFLERKDFPGAHFHAQWMLSEKVHNDYEYAILQTTLADTYARNNHIHRALMVIRDVTRRSTFRIEEYEPGGPLPAVTLKDFALWRTPFELEHLLKLRFVLAESQGLYLDALRAHADLQALGFIKPDDPTSPRFQALLQKATTAPTLTGHIRIEESGKWLHPLLHRRFRVANVRPGKLEEIRLSCAGNQDAVSVMPEEEIQVSEEAGSCKLAVRSGAGTEFDIIESRDLPAVTAPTAN